MGRIKDRIGILSTGVKVLSYYKTIKGEAYWNCECPICHQIWQVRGSHLNEPYPISKCKVCSSLSNLKNVEKPFYKDISNQKFGKLITVIEKTKRIGKTYLWKCWCDCGNICEKELQYLLNGDTKSCGCLSSSYNEDNIKKILIKNDIPFEQEKILFQSFRFDFYVNNQYIIEYDGKQHFIQSKGREPLKDIRKKDLQKNLFCFINNIPLIRIPYNKEYTVQDLYLNTTRFLLTKENENEYYRIN